MKNLMYTLGTLVLAASAFATNAMSDTVPAIAGRAWQPSEDTCFSTGSFSNQVVNTCAGTRSYLVPLTLRTTGNITFRASSSYSAGLIGTVPGCRVVLRSSSDASVSLGAQTSVAGQDISLGTLNVPNSSTTGQIDCTLDSAVPRFGLTQIRW